MNKKDLGQLGEQYAKKFLESLNYEIISQNFYCRFGEIDIIALNSQKNVLVFCEVKSRTQIIFGLPQEAVGHRKIGRMLKTAHYFIESRREKLPFTWRFDLIAIKLAGRGKLLEINHFKNILDG